MNTIKIFTFVISAMLIASCNSTNSDPEVNIDTGIHLVYRNMDGDNLLNPNLPNAITEQNTDLYYLVDSQKQKVFNTNLDCPKMFCIKEGNDNIPYRYFMDLSANTIREQDIATTYIQFSDGTMDTIKVGYEYSGNSVYLTDVWYNQDLRFDGEQDGEENPTRFIVVTKNIE